MHKVATSIATKGPTVVDFFVDFAALLRDLCGQKLPTAEFTKDLKAVMTRSADFRTAMLAVKRAVALPPDLHPALAVLAKLYLQSGEYKLATAECRKKQLNAKGQTGL